MAEEGGNGGSGDVIDRPGDVGGPMAVEVNDQQRAETTSVEGATVGDGSDGDGDREQEIGGEDVRRATEEEPRATVEASPVGPGVESEGSGSVAVGSRVVDRSSGGARDSGAGGDDTGPSESQTRDSDKGKGVVVEEERTTKSPIPFREEDVAFRPAATAATSLSHVPVTKYDIAEHLPDEMLAKLLEDNPTIREVVLKAKEDRARAIEASEAAERAKRERARPGRLAADVEAEEREAEETQGPRVRAVDEAGAMTRPEFSAEAYVPPRPRLFVPSGFAGYKPQQTDYEVELVLRDPRVHIANTWAVVEQRDIRGYGGPCNSLALYEGLPPNVRQLVDAAGFGEYIRTLSPVRNDHAVLMALAER
ncbi:hypothetical protein RHMOL_Rhmol02G0239900 [Rhododendron molle]|uniref:Uncharacterized protein n=1 Tax=Rhododendron molle TaxID=49168 RepID=A0ACC0PV67_RHOML|nr:hypothetical protein RHMOL_Rhmol02G0239900 [Rhododendron molle]